VTENENIDKSESDPPACEIPPCVLATYARFASSFDFSYS